MIRRGEGQFRIVDRKLAVFEIKQAARPAEVVQQMAIDMEKVCIIADAGDDMLVPNLGQHGPAKRGSTTCFQGVPPFVATDFQPSSAVFGWYVGRIGP